MKITHIFVFFFFLLLVITPINARTRRKSLENFILETRINNNGFANTPQSVVDIKTTTYALEISSLINYDVNNTLDILLFYQKSQNSDGGFGPKPNVSSTWDNTIYAIKGLYYLNLNSSHLQNWLIFEYLNKTATGLLYDSIKEGNSSRLSPSILTMNRIKLWQEYILSSASLGLGPTIPNEFLITELKKFQLNNGTYNSFEIAVEVILLLKILGENPNQVELASKFIRAHSQSNAAFSNQNDGNTTLFATYKAISALQAIDKLYELKDKNSIVRFILNQQRPNSGFSEFNSDKVNIIDSWYALQTLVLLNKFDELLSPDVIQTQGFVPVNSVFILSTFIIMIFLRKKR